MDEMIDGLGHNGIFTVLNARFAYWFIELHSDDRLKAVLWDLRTSGNSVVCNAMYQRMINFALSPVTGRLAMACLDDVVVHSRNFEEHLQYLNETLQLVKDPGFKMNLGKCQFAIKKKKN